MELNALLLGTGIFVLCAVVIYLISAVTMREKTYEEVMEEQRHKQALLAGKSKHEKKEKKTKKKVKGGSKKEKSGEDKQTTEDTVDEESVDGAEPHKMVQYELEPEVIAPVTSAPPSNTEGGVKQRKNKKEKQKPILLNKEEKPLVKGSPVKSGENLQADVQYHKPTPPLDALELKHERERKDSERSQEQPQRAVEETIVMSVAANQQSSPKKAEQPAKKSKSKKHVDLAQPSADKLGSSYSEVLSMIHSSQLTPYEIQTLTDELLSKQTASQEWTKNSKKTDPVVALNKQLADQSALYTQAKSELQGASDRVKELKQEVHQEKQRYSMMEKQTREKLEAQMSEIQALHSRMQHSHEQHSAEVGSLRRQIEQSQMNEMAVAQLREENRSLKQAHQQNQAMAANHAENSKLQQQMKILQDEMSRNVMRLNASENAKQMLEAKVNKYESDMQHMSSGQRENEAVLSKKLKEISEELRRSEAKNEELKRNADKTSNQTQQAEQELGNLRNSVKSLKDSQIASENRVKELQAKLQEQEKQSADLKNRLTSSDQESQKARQDADKLQEVQTTLASVQKSLAEKEQVVQSMTTEKDSLSSQVASLQASLNEQKSSSTVTIETLQQQLASGDVHKKASDLEKNHQEVLRSKEEEVDRLKQEVAAQKEKNNALEKQLQQDFQVKLSKSEEQTASLQKQVQEMQQEKSQSGALWEQLQQLQTQLSEKDKELSKVKGETETAAKQNQDLLHAQSDNQTLQQEVTSLKQQLEQAASQNKDKEAELKALSDEVDTLKKHSTSLERQKRELEESQFDSEEQLNSELSNLQTQLKQSQAKVQELSAVSQNEVSGQYLELLKCLHPEVKVTSTQSPSELVKMFEANVQQQPRNADTSALEKRLQESEETQGKLQHQVQHYQTVLSDTEDILNRLQSSVEAEEKRWQQKLTTTEGELKKAKQDAQRFHDELKSIKGSKEMEEKIAELENRLVETASEKQQLEERLSQGTSALEGQLSLEQKKVKDLTSEKVKLNSIVKMGQDALQQEQDLVKQLQEQLNKKGLANGTSDSSEVQQQ